MYLVFWFGKFTTRSTSLSWISLQRNNNSESWKNFNTQNNNLEANTRNASKPARFWLHILSFLHSQFTCKNWFSFVNNSVPWILITWSCRGDAHRSPGHPVGDAHNSVDIPLGLRADQVDIPWGTHAYQVDTQWDMLTHQGHIPYIRSLPTEQSVRLFPYGLILRRFCTNRKTRKSFAAEEVIVMNMTNREN